MDYDEDTYSELAMMILEHDINFICERYHIQGYELDDLKQEARLALWKALPRFRADKGILLRTWANTVIKNHLKNLLFASDLDKRRANKKVLYILIDDYITFKEIDEKDQEDES